MRTTLRDDLHALGRPGAWAAIGAALAGVVALRAPGIGAWALVATVEALGTADESTVAVLSAAEVTPLAWVATVVGVLVVVVSLLLAVDRPPAVAERLLLAAAVAVVAVGVAVLVARPAPADFAAHGRANDLVEGEASLPDGVAIDLRVRPAGGLAVLGAAGLAIAVLGTVASRRG